MPWSATTVADLLLGCPGELSDCALLRTSDGSSRGFGFVTYISPSVVDKVRAYLSTACAAFAKANQV
eukprot:9477266-Pyramimonas_sp.AAC.3